MPGNVQDSISFATPGPGLPSGFAFMPVGFGSGSIIDSSMGGAFPPHNWLQFTTNQFLECSVGGLGARLADSITVWFAWKSNGFSLAGNIFQFWGYPSAIIDPTGTPFQTWQLKVEGDNSISIYIGGSPQIRAWNSGNLSLGGVIPDFWMQPDVWYFFQIAVVFQFAAGGIFSPKSTIVVDGQILVQDNETASNFYSQASFVGASLGPPPVAGDPGCNFFTFSQPGDGPIGLSDVTAEEGYDNTPQFSNGIWNFFIDDPGSDYGPDPPSIVVTATGPSGGNAQFSAVLGPGGSVVKLIPIALGSGYTSASEPITLTAVPFGTPNGSGFSGHAIAMPVPNQKVPQDISEYAYSNPNPFIRKPQNVIERAWTGNSRGIHISQAVIELPAKIKSGPTSGDGWLVREC